MPVLGSLRPVLIAGLILAMAGLAPRGAAAAPTASFVLDIRTGAVYHAENADARLHPASLTKMMTLYLAFEAAARGEIDLDAMTTVSARAAAAPGARLGLRQGQRIRLRHLVRATAVRSGNDAAIALAEAIAGTEPAFVARMNARARAMGLDGTTFRNAHGLTAEGHLTTARDMSELGRRLWWDYPDEWALFRQITVDAGVARVAHTNRRFLSGYRGADGIKTGYTRAAGYTLTGSARRGEVHLIATVFGAPSSAARAARVSALLDAAFQRAPEQVAAVPPPVLAPGNTRRQWTALGSAGVPAPAGSVGSLVQRGSGQAPGVGPGPAGSHLRANGLLREGGSAAPLWDAVGEGLRAAWHDAPVPAAPGSVGLAALEAPFVPITAPEITPATRP